jgi:hypothetical protein
VAQPVGSAAGCNLDVFLPWVLPKILVTCIFAAQGRWARAPGGRHWSSLATVERPRTAQRRPGADAHWLLMSSPLSVATARVTGARSASEVPSSVVQLHPRFCLGAAREQPGT